jgi:hypothetical protein
MDTGAQNKFPFLFALAAKRATTKRKLRCAVACSGTGSATTKRMHRCDVAGTGRSATTRSYSYCGVSLSDFNIFFSVSLLRVFCWTLPNFQCFGGAAVALETFFFSFAVARFVSDLAEFSRFRRFAFFFFFLIFHFIIVC